MTRDVKTLSPAKAAGLYIAPRSTGKATLKSLSPFNCGDYVYDERDPRHVGRVGATFLIDGEHGDVRVEFPDGVKADIPFGRAVKTTKPE